MSIKPETVAAPALASLRHGVLALSGRDAAAFLQAQVMNDVARLADGQWQWNGWLTPKGRVIALFALLRVDAERFQLVLPDVDAGELKAQLQRFVFRSRVQLQADGWRVAAGPALAGADGARAAGDADGAFVLDLSGEGGVRHLWVLPAGHPSAPSESPTADATWHAADLAHGLPRLPPSQREAWTPQMLSLERLSAYSVRKGCYPGQEIVARTHFLGQAKRRLLRLAGDGLAEGAEVRAGDAAIGTVICVTGDGHEALAVVSGDPGDAPLSAGGHAANAVSLLGGLARE